MNTKTNYIVDSLERSDQKWSAYTHGFGFVVLLILFLPYLYYCSFYTDTVGLMGISIFLFSVMLTYGSSAIYHVKYFTPHRTYFQRCDHISIFFMIAGSNTPFILMFMDGWKCAAFMALFWGLVLIGTLYKIFFLNKYPWFSLCFYLLIGWLGLVTASQVYQFISLDALMYLLAGGVMYTTGTYFYNNEEIRYNHTIWHLFVMAGTALHLIGVISLL